MNRRKFIKNKGNLLLFISAIVLLCLSLLQNFEAADTSRVSRKTERRLEERIRILDRYINSALESDTSQAFDYNNFPEDMVIYRYVDDTLQAWRNQFSVLNDDITSKVVYQRISTISDRITSPLSRIKEELQYINLGTKWYIAKMVEEPDSGIKIIAGIEIKNDLVDSKTRSENGLNPNLGISRRYSIKPISETGGTTVYSGDIPLFKIHFESNIIGLLQTNSLLRWISLLLIMISGLIFLNDHKNWKAWLFVTITNSTFILLTYFWGMSQQSYSTFFSPAIYADGPVLYSFGAIFLLNLLVFNLILCTYIIQKTIVLDIRRSKNPKKGFTIQGSLTLLALILTLAYINWGFRSINLNSNISLSLYRWNENILYSILVYISYLSLLCAIMMELKCLKPAVQTLTGKNFNPSGKFSILLLVLLSTIYFSSTVINLGFGKEKDRSRIWSNKLAQSRDLELEFNIRTVEDFIANDKVMALLSENGNESQIANRVIEYYLHGQYHKYYIGVNLIDDQDEHREIEHIIRAGERISNDSRFFAIDDKKGFISYAGIFTYRGENKERTHMILSLESRESRGDRGYYSLLRRYSGNQGVVLPQFYSYAKYINGRLSTFKGRYPYPTSLAQDDLKEMEENNFSYVRKNKYTHFINKTSDDETVLISRQSGNLITFFTSISYLFLLEWFILHVFFGRKKIRKAFKKNYYRSRISTILFMTSVFILVGITTVSLVFVFQRNEVNLKNIMSSKISMLQSHVESKVSHADDFQDLLKNKDCMAAIQEIGDITQSDITLFTPRGKVLLSTTPEIFESMIVGSRINAVAYHNIVDLKQRFYVHDEKFEGRYYYSMYAPIFNDDGKMIAILSAPYTEENFNFKMETIMHTALVLNLFIILLLSSMFFSTHEVDEMFKPLLEMGKKMSKADLDNLEYIEYNREDEISKIVEEYNRMVKALQESKVIMAKAERNKAWSEMARQIAHEIKNPLTPIQLELQMLIRKKKNNDPVWIERFDKACDVILEHIKILTDTANLFSSVAKIYDDEPQKIDLDALVKKHISIYENKENIKVSYIGMPDCFIMAPRSQIIRVVVNLMTNSIQAIENMQAEQEAAGEKPTDGAVVVCLRRSTKDGYYDLVVEDNGPGVKDENLEKLFRPNFTTKSSGTGLGLAICRNIIEECKGEINYKKSFVLKGASFTVTLPIYED